MVGFFIILICIAIGIFTGLNLEISMTYAKLISVAIIACLDSVLGGFIASINKQFRFSEFLTSFFGNAIVTIILVFLGEKLNVDIYLGAVVVFTAKILDNLSKLRKIAVNRMQESLKKKAKEN